MNEARKTKEETTDAGLTTATLPGVGARPEVRAVAASSFNVGGGSSAGAATAPAVDERRRRSFRPKKRRIFAPGGMRSK